MPEFPKIQEIENESGTVIEPDTFRRVLVNDSNDNNDITFDSLAGRENARVRIGSYLSDATKGNVGAATHPNKFPLDRNITEVSLQDPTTGRPSKLRATENSNFWIERQKFQAGSVSVDGTLQKPDPGRIGFGSTWQHGESDNDEIQDGHTLLRVPINEATHEIKEESPIRAITSAILSNNRFTADNRLNPTVSAGGRDEPNNGFNPSIRLPDPNERTESLGKYNRGVIDTSFNNLAKIGMVLSLRGTGEVGSGDENYNPISAGAEAKAILPSSNQLGITRPEWENFRSGDVLKRLSNDEVGDSVLTNLGPSWGVMNNIYDPFDGITATGMPILAFTLILSMLAATELISFIVELISPGKPVNAPTKHSDGRYVFGKWRTDFPPSVRSGGFGSALNFNFPPPIGDLIGINPTQYSFGEALRKGTYLFFGIERSVGDVLGAAAGAAISSLTGGLLEENPSTPGYNAVFCRAVMRSTVTIIDSMKKLGSSPNFIAGIKNFLAIFEVIKSSKLVSAINVFTQVGDLALARMEADEVISDNLAYSSEIDTIEDNSPDAAITKSKLKGANKLAWAGNRVPSLMLMPATIFGMNVALQQSAASGLGGPAFSAIPSEALSKNKFAIIDSEGEVADNRIPSKGENPTDEKPNVQLMEETLESEYVPFYFHDIRTNEIISFHAFLNSLSEDFSPSWETTDGYGRIDQIAIYKSTARKLNLSFWVISTGLADFNDMWIKLNKLVTLVYPQYTRGRKLTTPDYTFTMPFSQIPSAGPIIRLRIGDLVRSNYSRFNLSRIFGFGDADGVIDGLQIDSKVDVDDYNKAIQELQAIRQAPWSNSNLYFSFRADRTNLASTEGISLSFPTPPSAGGGPGSPAGAPLKIPANLLPFFKLKPEGEYSPDGSKGLNVSVGISLGGGSSASQPIENKAGIFTVEQMTQSDIIKNFNISARAAANIFNKTKRFFEPREGQSRPQNDAIIKDRKFIFPVAWVDMLPSSRADYLSKNGLTTPDGGSAEALANFMKPSNNAIVKSFEDTGGMGLACRIDNLSFDWLDQVTWETVAPGEKAPQRVKISMAVTAIHDISPGIDNKGYNRAPIWPIGPMNTKINRNA